MTGITIFRKGSGLARTIGVVSVLAITLGSGVFADDKGGGSGNSGSGGGGRDDGAGNSSGSSSGSGSSSSGGSGSSSSGGSGSSSSSGSGSSSSSGSGSSLNRIESESREMVEKFGAKLRVSLETRDDRTRFKAEVEDLNLPTGTTVNVCAQGQSLGMVALDGLHGAELQLESRGGSNNTPVGAGSLVEIKVGACSAGVPAILSARVGNAGETAVTPAVQGRIEDRSRSAFQGFGAELQVEVEREAERNRLRAQVGDVNLTPGSVLNVCLRGEHIGRITLDDFHGGELEFDSRRGQTVPAAGVGDLVEVREGACAPSGVSTVALRIGRGAVSTNSGNAQLSRLEGEARASFAGFAAKLDVRFEAVGARQRFRAQVENVNLPAGTSLNVCRQGQLLGTLTVNALHTGELELNSRDGVSVPALSAGDVIGVRQGGCASAATSLVEATLR